MSFPTGVSINNCAAHYTPNPGDDRVLLATDLIKIDIGTHAHGHIIDSAFSFSFDPQFETLIQASHDATWAGLKEAGIDARLIEVGRVIEETMTSFEVEIDGKKRKVKSVRNLSGHQLGDYIVHAGKSVPIIANGCEPHLKMEEGEVYAIETFASTGKGSVSDAPDCSHYIMEPDAMSLIGKLRNTKAKHLLTHINQKISTLARCRRWLDQTGEKQHLLALKSLVDAGLVNPYPPLVDQAESFVSQHEHSIMIKPTAKEVVSYGGDD
jgi:methionyl aminopeptidase